MDVCGWLRGLGLGKYEAAFRDNGIDEAVLPHLTVEDLKELGVASVGDRRKLLTAIGALASPTLSEQSLQPSPAPPKKVSEVSAERRPITVMFCDLVGSTSLTSRLDAEDWRNLVNAYLDAAEAAVRALGGHVLKKLGDGLMALFGYPQAQENDAERAVRAALAIQRALADLNARNSTKNAPELSARIGLESGPVVVEATGEVFGDAPNVAGRVQAAADPGSVLVTTNVQLQVAGLFVVEERGPRELKGLPEPIQLFRIVRTSSAGRRGGARSLTPFIGRDEELGLLARRWDSVRAGEGQLVLIVGEPGLGKSRLIEEFHARLAETPHTWVEWIASQLLQNTPLHPIAEWGRLRFTADAPAEQRLADLEGTLRSIGLDPIEHTPLLAPLVDIPLPPSRETTLAPEELRRRQLAALVAWVVAGARSQPVVLAFEDLQWADPTSLDLLRALAERGGQAPLFLIATSRPEFRPSWSMRSHHSAISLAPLKRAQVYQMVGELTSRHPLSEEVVEGVSERTGGVPLFIEEVTRLLLERGVVGGVQAIPPTLRQSLAARLDRLGPAREVAQIGAVLGREFAYPLLRGVAEPDELVLRASLERLADGDLLFVEGAPPHATYRFKHALIQDAAYDSLLKSRRQALHRRAAEILRGDPERAVAAPEVIAHHFTEAGLDDQAIEWWGKAGDQALRRSAFQEAIAHLGKAIAMADKAEDETGSTVQRLKLQTSYGLALTHARGVAAEETKAAAARTKQLAAEVNDSTARFAVYRAQFLASFMGGDIGSIVSTSETYLREARNAGVPPDIALASYQLGLARWFQGSLADARTHAEEGLKTYDPGPNNEALSGRSFDWWIYGTCVLANIYWHLGGVERAQELIEQARTRARESRHSMTLATTSAFGVALEMFRGDAEAALRDAETLGEIYALPFYSHWARICRGWARARLGDREAGLRDMRQVLAEFAENKTQLAAPFYQGLLAELEAEGQSVAAALALIEEALALAERTGQRLTDAFLHRVRGDILLKASPRNSAPAEEAYLKAIAVAREQGARSFELRAALSLAKLYKSTGRPAEAHVVLAPALEGFAATPVMPEIAEAQALLAALAEMDEVKAAEAQRQQRLHLQTAYAQAMMWSKASPPKRRWPPSRAQTSLPSKPEATRSETRSTSRAG
jgi:class 3 adenylate cyclase/tetratricopeptide (TPR) repeat protein